MSDREQGNATARARKSTMSIWRRKSLVPICLLAGLAVLACLACMTSIASADVDMTGALEKTSRLGGSLGVESLATSASGDYKCTDKYSVVANWYYYYAIGNCPKGAEIEVVSYASENTETHEHSYGGFVNGAFSGCGWIDTRYPLEKQNSNKNSACGEGSGNEFKIAESTFMTKHNGGSTGDGYAVVNKKACTEYGNYRPWSSNNVEKELIRTAPAYAASGAGSNFPALKWRYTTKYESTDGTGQYVMVRDDRVSGGEGNWVFVPRSCLPSTLPENENERIPSKPAVTTEAASGVQTPSATLNGSVDPEGVGTTYYFQYGTTTNWNESSTQQVEIGSGTSTLKESVAVNGLAAGTTYYYRIVATSAIGTSEGSAQSFTMQSPPPEAATTEATNVQQEQATANGTVNPRGLDTHYYFQYGQTTVYGLSTTSVDAGSGTSTIGESATVAGLLSSTAYYYRIVASSSAGVSYGQGRSFVTPRAARPAIVTQSSALSAVWHGTDGNLYDSDAPPGKEWESWSPTWNKIGIPSSVTEVGDPAIVTQSGTLEIVWRGSDGNIYVTDAPPGKEWESWSPTWNKIGIPSGVTAVGDPAIVTQSSSLEFVWRGSDGNMYVTDAPPGKEWESWSPTWNKIGIPSGVTAVGDPAIVTQSSSLEFVWRGSDGNMYVTDAPPGKEWESWSPTWNKIGIPSGVTAVGDPAIVTQSSSLEFVWRGSDGNMYVTDAPPGKEWESWSPTWNKIGIPSGVVVAGDPAIVTHSSSLEFVWRGSDGNMYVTDAPPGKEWESWSPTWNKIGIPSGVVVAGDPAIMTQSSSLNIVWRGSDGNMYVTDAPPGKEWESWSPTWNRIGIPLGVTLASNP